MNENEVINKIKSRIGTKVSFKYPGNEGEKQGILIDRAIIPSKNVAGAVPYWDVVDLIEFKDHQEQWIRIGYYRKPANKINWGSQTTITEPVSVWKRILLNAAKEKPWFKKLLFEVITELEENLK
ncbi:MAG TPA: hypothetical protein PLJ84_09585 [Bacteroidales bacterium]|nr:hypothetical protein [Bacteroidales bacterium]